MSTDVSGVRQPSDTSVLGRARRTFAGSGRRLVDGLLSSGSRLSWFGLLAALVTLVFTLYFQGLVRLAIQVGEPLAVATNNLETNVDRSLVELRGWVAYGDPRAPEARIEIWKDIERSYLKLVQTVERARDRDIQERVGSLRDDLKRLETLQWTIEDMAGSLGNRPAEAHYEIRMAHLRGDIVRLLQGILRSSEGDVRAGSVGVSTILGFRGLFLELDGAVQRFLRTSARAEEANVRELSADLSDLSTVLLQVSGRRRPDDPVAADQLVALSVLLEETRAYLRMLPRILTLGYRPTLAQSAFEQRVRPVVERVTTQVRELAESQRLLRRQKGRSLFQWSFVVLVLALVLAIISGSSIYVSSRLKHRVSRAMARAKSLGQYILHERIGSGGMGEVYRAEHALLRRPSALKLLKTKNALAPHAQARFEDEVRLTSRLSHPNTIAIYDYGRTPDGIFYYVMELLDGVTLDALVEHTGPVTPARAVHILTQVCASLGEAHDEGLLHRDVKPSNIMLARIGGIHDAVKVVDFGLVTKVDASAKDDRSIVGTPRYMAPEIIRSSMNAGPASDIYAVGCVGYLLLTGTPVFPVHGVQEVIAAHLDQIPDRISVRAERPIPEDLEVAILACLAKDPDDRPESAGALARILRECKLEDSWTHADAEAWWALHGENLKAWVRRDRRETSVSLRSHVRVFETDASRGTMS
ncbi:MAG: serine/threonine-protein kinase [Myxococcota bacterium]